MERQNGIVKSKKADKQCRHCDKTFKFKYLVVQHERIHTGEKPYGCKVKGCNKWFMWRSSLVAHEKSHEYQKQLESQIQRMDGFGHLVQNNSLSGNRYPNELCNENNKIKFTENFYGSDFWKEARDVVPQETVQTPANHFLEPLLNTNCSPTPPAKDETKEIFSKDLSKDYGFKEAGADVGLSYQGILGLLSPEESFLDFLQNACPATQLG